MVSGAKYNDASQDWRGISLQPGLVTSVEAAASVLLLKGPPSSHPRQLPTTKTIGLSMSGNGSNQVEEVKYDALLRRVLHTNGNECLEGVACFVRILVTVSA